MPRRAGSYGALRRFQWDEPPGPPVASYPNSEPPTYSAPARPPSYGALPPNYPGAVQ
jgi:hypothetical protein